MTMSNEPTRRDYLKHLGFATAQAISANKIKPMTLPKEISDRINAEAKKAAMIIEYGEYEPGPSNSARMQQTSRIDPIQKEFYVKGAIEWAGKAQGLVDALEWIKTYGPIDALTVKFIDKALADYAGEKEGADG